MTTFDLHIMRRLLMGFLLLIGVLIVFFIVLHYVEYIDDFFDRGATMRQVFLTYYPSYIPEIVKLTSPLALFLACIYQTGRLTQSLQIMALQTSGVSLYRLLWPYVLVALAVTGFMFWFNGWIVPHTNAVVIEFERQYLRDGPQEVDVSDIHRQNRPGNYITVGYFDRDSNTAHRVSIQRFDDARHLVSRLDAARMQWVDSLAVWRLTAASYHAFDEAGLVERRHIEEMDTTLSILPRDFARTERDVESMTIPDAAAYIQDLERSGAGGLAPSRVGYYVKFAYPFANLILILIGVPLAAVRRRGGQAVQIGLGLLTAFVYLAVQKLTEPFGYSGTLDPVLTAWLPHALFAVVAIVILIRARK